MENVQNATQTEPMQPKASETVYPPSQAQLNLIEKLVSEGKPKPPSGYKKDAAITKKYLDEVLSKKEPSPPKPVTEKQRKLIGDICDALGLFADHIENSKQASEFISEHLEAYKNRPDRVQWTMDDDGRSDDDFS
jgi:hypothetical protein